MSNSLIDRRLMLLKSFCNFKVTVKSRLEKALIVCQLGFVLFSVSGIVFVSFISITFLPAGTNCMDKTGAIHSKEKDGDWYCYRKCFAHENSKRAYKKTKKICKSGTTAVKPYLSKCPVGLVWFPRYCGKMYSRHLFYYTVDYETFIQMCLIFLSNN